MATNDPFDILLDRFRQVVREEIAAAFGAQGKVAEKEWLSSAELAKLYGLPKTWFEERGRQGEIERAKPGRYVIYKRRDVERFMEEQKEGGTDDEHDAKSAG